MRFGLFYEHQLPRPWAEGAEAQLLQNALDQVELADGLGFDYVWEVEHHFLEEYSHSSAPEVFLAAASQRTKNIRLGHGIVALPPAYNHPARVAERIATLDIVSNGRVDFGTGETSSQMELGAFGVPRDEKRAQWDESLDAITRMFVEEPFAGVQGRYITMPPRNVVPKPVQKPHPPVWVACSRRDTILLAAHKGIGALSFSFVEPEEAKRWVDDYYAILASDACVPAGFAVNPNIAVVVPFMCHRDEQTAIERGIDGAHFFGYSLAHYYVFGEHRPARTNIWSEFVESRDERGFARDIVRAEQAPLGLKLIQQGLGSLRGAVGTPDQIRELCLRYEAAGVDLVIFAAQAGPNRHEDVCEAIELFGKEVLPDFAGRVDEQERAKQVRLAESCEAALLRRSPRRESPADYVVSTQSEPWGDVAGRPRVDLREHLRARVQNNAESLVGRVLTGVGGRSPGAALWLLFNGMARRFNPEGAQGFTGDIQYVVGTDDGERPWYVQVGHQRASAHRGRSTSPAVTILAPINVLGEIAAGKRSAGGALLDGVLKIDGDFGVASRLAEMFGGRSPW